MQELITRLSQNRDRLLDVLTPSGRASFTEIYRTRIDPVIQEALEMNNRLKAENKSLTERLTDALNALSKSEQIGETLIPEIESIQDGFTALKQRLQSTEVERDAAKAETQSLRTEIEGLRARDQGVVTSDVATQTTGNARAVIPIDSRMAMPTTVPTGFKGGATAGVRLSYGNFQAHAGINALSNTPYGFHGVNNVSWKPMLEIEYTSDTPARLGPFLRGNVLSKEGSLGYEVAAHGFDFKNHRSAKLIASRNHVFATVETPPMENGVLIPLVKNLQDLNIEVGMLHTVPTSKADVVMRAPLVRVRDIVQLTKHSVDTMQSSLAVPAAPVQSKNPPRSGVGDGLVCGFMLLATVGVLWNRVRSRVKAA